MTQPDSTANTGAVEAHNWHHRAIMASVKLGAWMSAALDDPAVCEEMKADIREWFSAGEPFEPFVYAMTRAAPTPGSEAEVIERAAAEIERVTALNVKARRDRADDALAFEFQGLGDVLAKVVRALSPTKERRDD